MLYLHTPHIIPVQYKVIYYPMHLSNSNILMQKAHWELFRYGDTINETQQLWAMRYVSHFMKANKISLCH